MRYVLESGQSVLDLVLDEAKALERRVSRPDQRKLGEFFSSVRDVEKKIQKRREWLDRPSPKVDYELPKFDPVAPDLSLECETMMYDLMALALETDSTRVITLLVPGAGQVFTIDGEKLIAGYHGLSHHGNDPTKIADFNRIGRDVTRFGVFLDHLRERKDAGQSLLESAIVLAAAWVMRTLITVTCRFWSLAAVPAWSVPCDRPGKTNFQYSSVWRSVHLLPAADGNRARAVRKCLP